MTLPDRSLKTFSISLNLSGASICNTFPVSTLFISRLFCAGEAASRWPDRITYEKGTQMVNDFSDFCLWIYNLLAEIW